jgi:hypothetical protein
MEVSMEDSQDAWFPAKRYGWGWGLPRKWQGWVVLLVYLAIIVLVILRFPPAQGVGTFLGMVLVATFLFGLVCWWKGETPRWRWGDKSR